MTSAIGLRYARALADVILEPRSKVSPDQALAQLRDFAMTLGTSRELESALLSPAVQGARKRAVIASLGAELGLAPIIQNFLFVLVDHRRVSLALEIVEGLQSIFDEHFGFAGAEIKTARELDAVQASALEAQLARMSGKQIRARYQVDPELLGGAVARIGSTLYDGSVRGQFEQLRRSLTGDAAAYTEGL